MRTISRLFFESPKKGPSTVSHRNPACTADLQYGGVVVREERACSLRRTSATTDNMRTIASEEGIGHPDHRREGSFLPGDSANERDGLSEPQTRTEDLVGFSDILFTIGGNAAELFGQHGH